MFSATTVTSTEQRIGQALDELFDKRGAEAADTRIVLSAEPYLDTAGEALRRRIFLTRGEGGENLCLRPDFTIPVCMRHVAQGADLPKRYSYRGLVFRQRADGPGEFVQAGIEDLGEENRATADARALADSLASLEACGVDLDGLDVILGDQGLFEAVLRALGLPEGWQRRLIRTFGDERALEKALDALSKGAEDILSELDPQLIELARDREEGALTRLIRARMEDAGLPPHSGRSPGEVASRLIEKVAVAEARLGADALSTLEAFLSVDCSLAKAGERLGEVSGPAGLDLGRAMTVFETRNLALQAANVDLNRVRYRAAFGRPIDYYTGLVFEARLNGASDTLAGGGRYDRLLTMLGADRPIPAVGFSLWLDRIGHCLDKGEGAQ